MPYLRPFLGDPWKLYAICPEGPRLQAAEREGIVCLPLALTRRLLDPMGDAVSTAQIVRHCLRERFDIVHTHNIKAGLIGRVAAGLTRTSRIVHTMHGMPFDMETPVAKRLGHAGLEWIACRFADRILVQSEEDQRTILAHRLIARERLVRIGNGVPLAKFDPSKVSGAKVRAGLGLAADDIVFLSAGRLVREKGFVELAEAIALAHARDPRVRLVVAGALDEAKADCLRRSEVQRARECGALLVGERRDMPEVIAAADVGVLVSWREGLPRFLMECAAMEKPLIGSDVRGNREVVGDRGGLLVPVRSPDRLADAMLELAADEVKRKRIGAENRRRALEEFDLDAVVARIDAVYRELVA